MEFQWYLLLTIPFLKYLQYSAILKNRIQSQTGYSGINILKKRS
jgi:hypothetical protein